MTKHRQAARIDANQPDIVKKLRQIGATVSLNHDDILVGYRGKTYWYEIKDPEKTLKQDGTYKAGALKDSQIELLETWKGHYRVVHSYEQIAEEITSI
tara:strand:+ start:10778 stop:11071 length:294 start_codon:yes stop_codon:yes gene_type:complete